jgi:hypothetical protein
MRRDPSLIKSERVEILSLARMRYAVGKKEYIK